MPSPIIQHIREQQRLFTGTGPEHAAPPEHRPEFLLIGCVDARLNLKTDIGIPDGKALIFRNVAALVAGREPDRAEHLSEAAVLEFAVNVMGVSDIVVMGHTDCGGIAACLKGQPSPATEHLHLYLGPLAAVRLEVRKRGGDLQEKARAMEQAAVRQSVVNLRTYEAVKQAELAGRVQLHGWIIDTGTRRIKEMDEGTGEFIAMGSR